MSRYFTSPPPVYARNWANGQNLVESTKMEKPIIASKKVHRKEKKDRKKEKKQKTEKTIEHLYFPTKQVSEKTIEHLYFPTKQVSDESDQNERSCLTDEHEKYLSDGSQDSKKRRRVASPVVESNIKATPVSGNPLRIRIVLKKPKEAAEVVVPQVPQEDLVCSTSGTDQPSNVSSSVSGRDENLPSTSNESDKTASLSESKKKKKHKTSKESRYSSLFDVSVPPCLSMEEDSSDSDDWLLSARRQENVPTKSNTDEEDTVMNMQKSEACFPSSQFLSEVGIFSLPYAVLF